MLSVIEVTWASMGAPESGTGNIGILPDNGLHAAGTYTKYDSYGSPGITHHVSVHHDADKVKYETIHMIPDHKKKKTKVTHEVKYKVSTKMKHSKKSKANAEYSDYNDLYDESQDEDNYYSAVDVDAADYADLYGDADASEEYTDYYQQYNDYSYDVAESDDDAFDSDYSNGFAAEDYDFSDENEIYDDAYSSQEGDDSYSEMDFAANDYANLYSDAR